MSAPGRSFSASTLTLTLTFASASTCLYALFVVAWYLARLVWGDRYWWLAGLNSFATLLFLPAPLALIAAAVPRGGFAPAWRRAIYIAALVPVVLWVGLFGWRFLPRAPRSVGSEAAMRVMAFNLLASNGNVDGIIAAIEAGQPDLLALSELTPAMDAALANRLAAIFPYRTQQTLTGASPGVGIYSRWPLANLPSGSGPASGSLQTGLGLRSAAADVRTPHGDVRFVALHPRATLVRGGSLREIAHNVETAFRSREAQIAAVCRHLAQWGDRPVILAGDFNMTEFSDAYRCVASHLHDAYREVGLGFGHTWPDGEADQAPWSGRLWLPPLTRIDYVFHSRHWVATEARVLAVETGSDHRPVVATLRWIPQ